MAPTSIRKSREGPVASSHQKPVFVTEAKSTTVTGKASMFLLYHQVFSLEKVGEDS
jgi:hypothetical protein